MTPVTSAKTKRSFDPDTFLATIGKGKSIVSFSKKATIFGQGDQQAIYYIHTGRVKLTVLSSTGKDAASEYGGRVIFLATVVSQDSSFKWELHRQ